MTTRRAFLLGLLGGAATVGLNRFPVRVFVDEPEQVIPPSTRLGWEPNGQWYEVKGLDAYGTSVSERIYAGNPGKMLLRSITSISMSPKERGWCPKLMRAATADTSTWIPEA